MQIAETTSTSERRSFTVHRGIIKTLINEQAGSIIKAFAELIMNAVDANATRVDIEIDKGSGEFVLRDNGRGFTSRDEIERFFETFGTPHSAGDAQYGRFRIGRGQIMSYAKTAWRSGRFEMRVDLESNEQFFGYELFEHEEEVQGCTITGTIYRNQAWTTEYELIGNDLSRQWGNRSQLADMILYVPIPVTVNGEQVNLLPADEEWDCEDDYAHYLFDRKEGFLQVFNCGVHVCNYPARELGVGGVITTKQALHLNLARNSVITAKCAVWRAVYEAITQRFSMQLGTSTKLNDQEAARLLYDLFYTDTRISPEALQKAISIRFIPDVFGELKAPKDFLAQERYTLFDGKHMGIAERVQREGLATVIMPELLLRAKADISDRNAENVILRLRQELSFAEGLPCNFIPFEQLVKSHSDTSSLVPEESLNPEEKLVLKLLRDMNRDLARMCLGENYVTRKIIAGVSDCMNGWTDGITYIAINRRLLKGIRGRQAGGSPAKLITIILHEYAHLQTDLGEHHHDLEFHVRYHEATMHPDFGLLVDKLFRKYVTGIAKLQLVPSAEHRSHLNTLCRDAGMLKGRIDKGPQLPRRPPLPMSKLDTDTGQ